MTTDALKKYAELKHKAKLIQNELDFLSDEVMKQVAELAGDDRKPVDTEYGTFILAKAKAWTYSKEGVKYMELLAKQIEERKAEEKATGAATFEEKLQLRFNVKE